VRPDHGGVKEPVGGLRIQLQADLSCITVVQRHRCKGRRSVLGIRRVGGSGLRCRPLLL